jgi:hypothetical protein
MRYDKNSLETEIPISWLEIPLESNSHGKGYARVNCGETEIHFPNYVVSLGSLKRRFPCFSSHPSRLYACDQEQVEGISSELGIAPEHVLTLAKRERHYQGILSRMIRAFPLSKIKKLQEHHRRRLQSPIE